MMIRFEKYQGAGNDFIMIDNREGLLDRSQQALIERLCDRRFGIGADGLILLQNHPDYDFEMVYLNADGRETSMCGNGGRCTVAFAKKLGIIEDQTTFWAIDGEHEAILTKADWVELKMIDVPEVEVNEDNFILNTGSPHYIKFVDAIDSVNVFQEGRAVRYNDRFKEQGINVNFVAPTTTGIDVATYERGVEDETLACGTGVTAAAIAYFMKYQISTEVPIRTKGGRLAVRFEALEQGFQNIWLCGPATFVFEGVIKI